MAPGENEFDTPALPVLRAAQVPPSLVPGPVLLETHLKDQGAGLLRSLPAQRAEGQPQSACSPSEGGIFKSSRSNGVETSQQQPLHHHL